MQPAHLVPVLTSIVLIALFALLLRKILKGGAREHQNWPFYAKKALTPPEQILYFRLVKALPDHIVLAQVQCSRVLGVKTGFNFNEWNNRINRMSYDFVICQKDATVVAAIELDDATHQSARRAATDAKKNRATEAAGILLVRWDALNMPDERAIAALLLLQ